jgi:ATP-dependent protease Clp ATPase subunit
MSTSSIKQIGRILDIHQASEGSIRPHFTLTGPSGSGKSHNIALLCEMKDIPVIEINAAQLTKEGTSGNSLSKALTPLLQHGGAPVVIFVDEFDKLFISGNTNSELAHETTNGVQNEFLKVLESNTASVFHEFGKYVNVPVGKALFIFAGAFNGEENIDIDRLRAFGIKTEFLGRVGLTFAMEKVTLEQLEQILNESPLLADYLKLCPEVDKGAVLGAVMEVVRDNYEKNTLGVRLINTLLHQYFINGTLNKADAKKSSFQKTLSMPQA